MTDKQIIIEDCPYFIGGNCQEYLDGVCENHKCDLKIIRELEEKLSSKEQECEEFRKANDEKNELLAKLGCPTIATARRKVFCLQEQLDQLKAENDELKRQLETKGKILTLIDKAKNEYSKENNKLKTTLTEIKEIAQYDVYTPHTDLCLKLNWIKKKISECEVE